MMQIAAMTNCFLIAQQVMGIRFLLTNFTILSRMRWKAFTLVPAIHVYAKGIEHTRNRGALVNVDFALVAREARTAHAGKATG